MASDPELRMRTSAGNTKQVLAQVEKDLERVTNRLNAMTKAGSKGTRKLKGGFSEAAKSAAGLVLATVGIGSGIALAVKGVGLLKREFTDLLQRQSRALQSQLTFEQSLTQAARNSIGIFSAEEVRRRSLKLAEEAGVTPTKAVGVIGSAVTSTGVTNKQEAELAIKAAVAALKFAPELDQQGLEALAGVAASISKRFKVTAEAAIGFIQRVGGQANVRELEPLISNVAPVVSNLTQFGFKPAEAGALVSTLTQGTGDVTGELSGTAAINLADSLAKQVKARPDRFGGLKVNEAGAIVDEFGKAAAGRALEILKNDPELKEVFFQGGRLDGISTPKANLGKGKAKPTIRGILTQGTVAQRQFEGSKKVIGGFEEGQKTFDDFIKDVKKVTAISRTSRKFKSIAEGLRVTDKAGGRAAAVREGVEDILSSSGLGKASRDIALLKFELGAERELNRY
ncbi:MAG: hypothetical protein IH899_01400 [Planctomycetes bacterium]|nr:hypothetical protein [Planctomycetota bacterium]